MKDFLISFLMFALQPIVFAQEREFKKMSFGMRLQRVQNEFGIGLHAFSPEFGSLMISARMNINWLDHLSEEGVHVWTEFLSSRLGINRHCSLGTRMELHSVSE